MMNRMEVKQYATTEKNNSFSKLRRPGAVTLRFDNSFSSSKIDHNFCELVELKDARTGIISFVSLFQAEYVSYSLTTSHTIMFK